MIKGSRTSLILLGVLGLALPVHPAPNIGVSLTNHPSYFFSHYCDLTLNITLPLSARSPQILLYIRASPTGVRFSSLFRPYHIHLPDRTDTVPYLRNPCPRSPGPYFSCLKAENSHLHSNDAWGHKQLWVTMHNVVCPREPASGQHGQTDLDLLAEYVQEDSGTVSAAASTEFLFSGLLFKSVEQVRVNFEEAEAREMLNYAKGCQSILEVSFLIRNGSQLGLWQEMAVSFSAGFSQTEIQSNSCGMGLQIGTNQPFLASEPQNYPPLLLDPTNCSVSANTLYFHNPNYNQSAGIRNPDFTPYDVMDSKPVRHTFRVRLTVWGHISLHIRVTGYSKFAINQSGLLEEHTQGQEVLYASRYARIYALEEEGEPGPTCRKSEEGWLSRMHGAIAWAVRARVYSFPLLLVALGGLIISFRSSFWGPERYCYIILVLTDPVIKLGLLRLAAVDRGHWVENHLALNWHLIDAQLSTLSYILPQLVVVQFLALNWLLVLIYSINQCTANQLTSDNVFEYTDLVEEAPWKVPKQMKLAVVFNYKLALFALETISMPFPEGLQMPRSGQLSGATVSLREVILQHSTHLFLEALLLLGVCTYVIKDEIHIISTVYLIHQTSLILCILLALRYAWTLASTGQRDGKEGSGERKEKQWIKNGEGMEKVMDLDKLGKHDQDALETGRSRIATD